MLKKTNKYQTLLAVCLLTLSACSTNETLTDSPIDQSKTPIELTAGIIGENAATTRGLTRTVTNDSPYGSAATAFSSGTSLYMVIKSENETSTTSTQYTRTIGYAQETAPTPANSTTTGFASAYQRYWEDTQSPARDSKLSIYAACVPGYYLNGTQTVESPTGTQDATTAWTIGTSNTYTNTWGTGLGATTIAWPLRGTAVGSQDATFLANQDLCFSNNVSLQTFDKRLAFDTTNNKFTSGRMVFHHALTKVTFKIKKGNGFGTDPFAFTYANAPTNPENIVLVGFNTSGTFNIANGEFLTESPAIGTGDIKVMSLTDHRAETNPDFEYELTCLMLPGSTLNGSDKDALDKIYFTIDENKYHITKSQLAGALASKTLTDNSTSALDEYKMRPGVHYVFTMTVSKSQISNLSAAVVGWEEVTASTTPSNARISVSLLENGTAETSETPTFDLFRSANVNDVINDNWASYDWATGYGKAYLQKSGSAYAAYEDDGHNTPWYWPNNRTFYHFRTLKPTTDNSWGVITDNSDANNVFQYVTLTGATYSTTPAESYRDVCWGAPFNSLESGQELTYSLTTGFDNTTGTSPNETHQISKAIGPTTATINMNTFHMMSDVTIKLTTTDGTDAVTLSGATVKLTPVFNTGTVKMGNGLITPGGSTTINGTVSQVGSTNTYQWHYGFVPQSLANVVLTITTTDNNQYIINMEEMVAAVNSSIIANPYTEASSGKYTINYWYPNFKYTYTFKLKKTGVEAVTATLTEWGAVEADEETVVIQ